MCGFVDILELLDADLRVNLCGVQQGAGPANRQTEVKKKESQKR